MVLEFIATNAPFVRMCQVGSCRIDDKIVKIIIVISPLRRVGLRTIIKHQLVTKPIERHVDTQNGHNTLLTIVDGHQVGHQWRLFIIVFEESFCPISAIFGNGLQEPFRLQIVVVLAAHGQMFNGTTVATHGIRAEPTTLLGIVVSHEANATTADAFVRTNHPLHNIV